MKKLLCFTLFLFSLMVYSNAQVLAINNHTNEKEEKSDEKANDSINEEKIPVFVFNLYSSAKETHTYEGNTSFWGEVAGSKKEKVEEMYLYTTTIAPGNPGTKTIIRKPAIYNAVQKLEKFYRKKVRKGVYSEKEAESAFLKVLNVAEAAFPESTSEFEEKLKATNDIEQLALIFDKAIIKVN